MSPSAASDRTRDALADLPSLAPLPTAAERASAVIRENIFEGRFQPGAALPENALAQALGVSRNTVREAYRTLMNEHLLTYEIHKGVTVRRLTTDDVRDIYGLRRMHELSAIEELRSGTATVDGAALRASVVAGQRAGAADDWVGAGTADLRFHAEIVAVHGSPRLNSFFRRLMTEMRLGFLALTDPHAFHAPYLVGNADICESLIQGRWDQAHTALRRYLDAAEHEVVTAVTAR
jgi:DNA-binding GntR family transcriptional regulator